MREAHPLEREIGVAYYVSDVDGIGGRLRERDADFRVRERERFDAEPLDADPNAYPHLVFRATLAGWDTNDFASAVSDALGISRERVSWAGTKDKRAVTTQLFSVRAPEFGAEDLPAPGGAEIEPVGRAGRPIGFGDLAGNEFEVVVRDAERPVNVEPITAELADFVGGDGGRVGVPNYFGQQRFGSKRPITHQVGLRIVRRDWEGAVLTYLGNPREAEPEETREARSFVERELRGGAGDVAAALERFPDRLRYERAMLHRLAEDGTEDFRAALEALPSNLRQLFVNAAQSYAFNLILSERFERGLPFHRAREGDVVCFADVSADGLAVPDADRLQRVTADRVETINRHCERGRAFVTAPLLGTDTDLAGGEQGEIERAVFDDLDLASADFDLPGEFRSTGTRRAILARTDLRVEPDPLTFSFALPSGSYATVLLREYLKTDPTALT